MSAVLSATTPSAWPPVAPALEARFEPMAAERLDIAEVVDPLQHGDNDQVFFGATVTLCDTEGQEQTYTIVGIDEADATLGRISWISPLARALIKSREGDSVRFQSPAGIREIEIMEVRYAAVA